MFKLSNLFIFIAVTVALAVSGLLWFNGYENAGLYTAVWVPSILTLGICFNASMLVLRSKHS